MRALLLYAFLLLLCNNSKAQTAISSHSSNKIKSSKDNIDQEWLARAQQYIIESGYYFKPETNPKNFYSSNAAQRLGFHINNSTYLISPIRNSDKLIPSEQWEERLTFSHIARNGHEFSAESEYTIRHEKSNLQYNYPGFSIQYLNDPHGLRQNFIITEKLPGSDNLELLLNIDGPLSSSINNNELLFNDENGKTRLYYRDLKAWDADHKPLSASMQMRDKNELTIIVNDQEARYPITIDPLNQTPEWTTSADGLLPTLLGSLAVEAAYGFSVAGLGDVNGDGFADVAVGAPATADVISGSGSLAHVGAVFVYFGSATGLPIIPSAVLQPTTAIAGALFGFSIAGGDVNNDGHSDIIVGAPLDNTTISIGGGGTATGKVGKVYVFNGATLNTTTTPFFVLQLSGSGILENGINLSVNALFGFSVAVTEDLNGDGKNDMIVGAPTYAGIKTGLLGVHLLDVQSGGAFVFLTNVANTNTTIQKLEPIKSSLLGLGILESNINGLLFGYAVDGLGDYNNDSRPDVVATAPAGIDASSISGLLNGKLLQGSAIVYYGTGAGVNTDPGATLTATSGGLLSNLVGSIANLANLFGESVRGVRNPNGARNGNVLVGAPLGNDIINVLNLQLKTGTVSVFIKKASSPSGYVIPDQVLTSPRNSNNILQIIQSNLLFGYSLDNVFDINCDGIGDIIVGEPASSGAQLLNANATGGAAYVYLGVGNGTYQTSPAWTLTAVEDAFLGINGTSLIGYSVAGAGKVKGNTFRNRILVGSPSRTLDFGAGLLNLGATFGTLFSLVAGDNGLGKAFAFDVKLCDAAPVAVNDQNSTNEDTPVNGDASTNDTPSEDGGNVWSLDGANGGASHGTVTMNPDGTYTYTPNANYNGTDVFNYKVCDADNDCSSATVTITINPVDDFPLAVNDTNTTNEDTPVNGNASTNDTPSGDGGNTWVLVGTNGGAAHGTVTMNPDGTYTYTPAPNYNGTDVFTYKLCDADNDCSTATVTITINAVDDLPVAVNDTNSTNEDTPVNGNASTNDTPSGDGGNTWVLVGTNGGAAHGTVTMNPDGTYTYTPEANFHGTDVFTYKLCDVDNDCSTATVTITIISVDDLPVAVDDTNSTNEDTPVNGNASTNDTPSGDGGNTWVLVGTNGGAAHGTVTMNPDGTYTYTPAPNYNGTDVFTYKLCDADNDCSTATVTITINSVDDAPVAVNDANSTNEDTPVNGNASTNDTPSGDGGNTWVLVGTNGGAAHGTVTMNPDGTYTYTPAPNFHGTDVFNYKVCDADNDCSSATVTITINSVNDVPIAVNDVNSTNEDTPVNGNASTNDTPSGDGGNTWVLVGTNGGASHGTVTMNPDGSYTYTPAPNYNGTDIFTYKVCDVDNDCSTATITITINSVDDAPVAVNDANSTNEDTPVNGNASTNDTPSGDGGNTWVLVGSNGGAAHGTVTMNPDGSYTYTPAPNFHGTDVFTYKLCDADNDCSNATVTITVNSVDDMPVAVKDVNSTNEDTPVSGNASTNDTPSGDGGNTWVLVGTNGGALHGTVTMNSSGSYTYTPAPNFNGTDVFTYRLCDADNDCSTATVTITINPVDDVPVAVNDVKSTNEDTPVSGNASTNDTPSGDGGNTWVLVGAYGGAAHGTVTMNANGTYTYTPAANFNGTDVFNYRLCDADNDCSNATVTITINPVDDSPLAVKDVNSTNEDTPVSGNVSTNDTPSGDGGNTWVLVGANGGATHGTVTMNPDGSYTYTPAPNFHGTDVFNYKVCDADNDCSSTTVTITVNSVDDMPVAVNDVNSTNEDTPVSGNASTNDTPSGDGGNIWTLVGTNGGASHGTVTMTNTGSYTYTPAPNFNGTDVFTYKVCDADNDCSTATVTITVNAVDDAPVAVNDVNSTNKNNPVSGNASTNDTPSGDGGNTWALVGVNGGASHGTVTMNSTGSYTYTPASNFVGTDVFTYKLCDADNDCSTATVTITVNDFNCNNNTIIVNTSVTVNFTGTTPTYSGDPDLQPFFSFDKTGPNPEGWRAIFNIGANKLLVKNGATITTTRVNGAAPGIQIIGTCTMEVEFGGHIIVSASNKNAGNIDVQMDGSVLINGEVKDEATGTLGLPGHITIVSKDDNITEGSTGLIQILGIDPGGNTITLQTCKSSLANNGDITIAGLVKSYAHAHTGDQTLNRPNINVVSLNGSVTINANTAEPLYDEQSINGGLYDIYGGLLSWVRDNVIPGNVKVQAKNNITVNGHGTDPTGTARTSFGAIAAIATASSSPGGTIDVRSIEGAITGNDRAFDVSGKNLLATNYALIRLHAKGNISLNRLGANNNFNPVVNASSPISGGHGGTNELRSFSGSILIGTNAIVSASVPAGSGSIQGVNQLTTCTGITLQGTVVPSDQNAADNTGSCTPVAPTPLFTDCPGDVQTRMITETRVVPEESVNSILAYPNPASGKVTLRLSSNTESRYHVELVDISGRTFSIGNYNATIGMNYYSFDLSNMAKGVYMIIARNDVTKLTTKIAVE